MKILIALILLAQGCAAPVLVDARVSREIKLPAQEESWRHAYFDAATRVLARRSYTFVTSDRPAVLNTHWKPFQSMNPKNARETISFRFQFTTTNQGARLHATVNNCFITINAFGERRWVACNDNIATDGWSHTFPGKAENVANYISEIEREIQNEVGPIHQELLSKVSAPPAAPVAAAPANADCRDAADCALQCDGGSAPACARMGAMVENGIGVAPDAKRAATYYERACKGGVALGCTKSAELRK